jgi:hypothetical protein
VQQTNQGPELIQFTVRAQITQPNGPAEPEAPARGRGRGARGRGGRAG